MENNKLNDIWNRIADDLGLPFHENNREALLKAIHNLPKFEAPEKIWENIENKLNNKTKVISIKQFIGIAASIIIVLGLSFILIKLSTNESKIQYTMGNNSTHSYYEIADTTSIVFNKIINTTCVIKPSYCASMEFKNFEEQYKSLELMQAKILKHANQYDNDNELEEMLIRIENQKKGIAKYIIEQINS